MDQKSVFISYRRDSNKHLARSIFQDLTANGWDVFLDVNTIDSGNFDRIILNQIGARAHFILLISKGSLSRCADANDWVLREIREAVRLERNIVPIVEEEAKFDDELAHLPDDIRAEILKKNVLPLVHFYFESGMDNLRTRFLKAPKYIPIQVSGDVANTENILSLMWDSLDPQLQDAMSIAYNQAVRNGSNRISTRYFFGAVMRLKEIEDYFPEDSLPEPIDSDLQLSHSPIEERAPVSTCVNNALMELSTAKAEQRLSLEDVFVDVAKYGTGSSVARLRTHGVDSDKVDQIVQQLGWNVIARQ